MAFGRSRRAADRRPFREVFAQHAQRDFCCFIALDDLRPRGLCGNFVWPVADCGQSRHRASGVFASDGCDFRPSGLCRCFRSLSSTEIGRKPLQVWGFVAGAALVGIFALMQNRLLAMPVLGFAVYGLFNVAQTGPGLVSGAGILGVELAPTRIRTVAQSLTVAGGRIGAALSAFAFPLLFAGIGRAGAYWYGGARVLGAVLTQVLVP